jgi:endoglucanase
MKKWIVLFLLPFLSFIKKDDPSEWIRINQLGYTPDGVKVAVWCIKDQKEVVTLFNLVNAETQKSVFKSNTGEPFGAYGPFKQTYRLNFSSFKKPGRYYLLAGGAKSPEFKIADDVYKGAADFCLRYMRQQRSGFNPFLKDSCHTHDGYVLYGAKAGIPDSTHIDVSGGWHDASDYLQYSATSANATYHLLAAYRDFPNVFTDEKQANGLKGKNGMADVLDEAKWGLDWLLKMHPRKDWMFNQVGDDRDHMGMRIPKQDTNFYGKGLERPVYFVSGEPQQRGKFMNNTTGTSSTAAKFASAFALGADIFSTRDTTYSDTLIEKAMSALNYAFKKTGVTQTASVRSPYIYAEENWEDDMELAMISVDQILQELKGTFYSMRGPLIASRYANHEPVTPWMGKDTASHYQWYPFINLGHNELARRFPRYDSSNFRQHPYYRQGIELVWNKAKQNAFYRGIPFIWCSNNLTTSFAIQCYWYKQITGDNTFDELEQANFDWLFGCNPWGTSMVYGLPSSGDTPVDPHSAFTHLKNYPIDGGLVDGPVYGSIFKNLIGIKLYQPDEYAAFQSDLAVFHDDYGDYSTNEPTMDGTASLVYLLGAKEAETNPPVKYVYDHGGIIRGDSTKKNIALVFTGHEFAEGGDIIANALEKEKIKASFFFTGRFYYDEKNDQIIKRLAGAGNFLGNHSMDHLLYCDWKKRDSLLVDKERFTADLFGTWNRLDSISYVEGNHRSLVKSHAFFLPPYEWYNDSISAWAKGFGMQLINYTPGTLSHADYTTSKDKNYRSSETIYNSIINYERTKPAGLNGFILLMHIGAGPDRADKFYNRLPQLIKYLKAKGYQFQTVDYQLKEY